MKLNKKRNLIARTLKVGKDRIIFNKERLPDIKEAITKQDIRDLVQDKAISIKNISGRKSRIRRKTRRRPGSVRKNVEQKKRNYASNVRLLRRHLSELKKQMEISIENCRLIKRDIRSQKIREKSQLIQTIKQLTK
mgnify:FL=1